MNYPLNNGNGALKAINGYSFVEYFDKVTFVVFVLYTWAPSSEFVSSSIP